MIWQKYSQIIRTTVLISAFIIVSLILWNTYSFFIKFKGEERSKMEVLAKAYERLSTADLNADISLEDMIISSNITIPMIITNEKNNITEWSNLDSSKVKNKSFLKKQLAIMEQENKPIVISPKGTNIIQYIYYRDSDLLTKLKFYPIALIFILLLFAGVIYLFFKSNKIAAQNILYTGMAKETAHQIGTPLTSLLGWIEILRQENTSESIVKEIENDVNRLNIIAERFSKIGSIPILTEENLVKIAKNVFFYLQSRSSKYVIFNFNTTKKVIKANINVQLFCWVIENLVKNAIDSMEGKGKISLNIIEHKHIIVIKIEDSGKGIAKNVQHKIFSPGFTTKKRGWGLGLSLAKRIIEDYHNGKITLAQTEINKGSTFEIMLKKQL